MDVDPVVQEMRRHGAEIAEQCGGDIRRMAEHFRRQQARHPHRVVRRNAPSPRQQDRDQSP